ncbi:hypothetical protein CYY_008294 [Polysphondylium violaceum]|uniref:Uncharacterized protein n=1 Tax=Polysphondylium violaceum TaxID=133409 RepID=A0A8J4UQ92_9MYCE|nr:hypothetical protein CYY_008294 [Polysphondylium violaceum]
MTFVKGVFYDPQLAKESVLQTKKTLTNIEEIVKKDAPSEEELLNAYKLYENLPLTYQINWSVAGEDANENQKVADFCRDKLNEFNHVHGFTRSKIPRAFNADNY